MAQRPNLPHPKKRSVPETARHCRFICQSAVHSIQRILDERNHPVPTKPKVQINNNLTHPGGLQPIHLSKDPITVEYLSASPPDPPIRKRSYSQSANQQLPKPSKSDSVRPRKKHKFIDDSVVESDGEGGDVLSVTTTPANAPPSTPLPVIEPSSPSTPKRNCASISLPPLPRRYIKSRDCLNLISGASCAS